MYDTSRPMVSTTMINTPLLTDPPYYPSSTVPTPPPSASSIDLPPIPTLSSYEHHLPLDDGPLSPASPKTLPAYLEPTPQINERINSTHSIRPQLFHLLAPPLMSFPTRRATAPTLTHPSTLYSPLPPPRRSHSQSMDPIRSIADPYLTATMTTKTAPVTTSTLHYKSTSNQHHHHNLKKRKSCQLTTTTTTTSTSTTSTSISPFQGQESCTSPTLTAACASAANLHTSSASSASSTSSSTLSLSLSLSSTSSSSASSLGSISTSVSPSSSPSSTPLDSSHPHRMKSDDDKRQMDQSMFLTKNAHIKRPRNAWIHFRCHYGQALKTQDPTLRAEEISKRASRRWSLLSENEKRPWHQMAEQEKQAHKEAFPEYRYCPKRATQPSPTCSQQHGLYRLPPNGLNTSKIATTTTTTTAHLIKKTKKV